MFFWFSYALSYLPVRTFAPFKVFGKNNVQKGQNYIIVCNHKSNFDPILLDFALGKQIKFLAKKELFKNKLMGAFLKDFGGIKVDREKGLTISQTKQVYNIISKKQHLCIFPQGTRSQDFEHDSIKAGACLFSIKTGTPILPCYIAKKHKWFGSNTIIIGKPFKFENISAKNITKQNLLNAEKLLKDSISYLDKTYSEFEKQKKLVRQLKKNKNNKKS